MLKKSSDPYLALLSYRATPLPWCQLSPAQLLMGRTLRTDVPQLSKNYQPEWQYLTDFRQREEEYRDDQKRNYDNRHRSKDLVQLPDNCPVWVDMPPHGQVSGNIVSRASEPRSYNVNVQSGEVRRNRSHLRERNTTVPETRADASSSGDEPRRVQTRSQTGAIIQPPVRYKT